MTHLVYNFFSVSFFSYHLMANKDFRLYSGRATSFYRHVSSLLGTLNITVEHDVRVPLEIITRLQVTCGLLYQTSSLQFAACKKERSATLLTGRVASFPRLLSTNSVCRIYILSGKTVAHVYFLTFRSFNSLPYTFP